MPKSQNDKIQCVKKSSAKGGIAFKSNAKGQRQKVVPSKCQKDKSQMEKSQNVPQSNAKRQNSFKSK